MKVFELDVRNDATDDSIKCVHWLPMHDFNHDHSLSQSTERFMPKTLHGFLKASRFELHTQSLVNASPPVSNPQRTQAVRFKGKEPQIAHPDILVTQLGPGSHRDQSTPNDPSHAHYTTKGKDIAVVRNMIVSMSWPPSLSRRTYQAGVPCAKGMRRNAHEVVPGHRVLPDASKGEVVLLDRSK